MFTIELPGFLPKGFRARIAEGRLAITNLVAPSLLISPNLFPVAAPGLLNSFVALSNQGASNWEEYSQGGLYSQIVNEAIAAMAWAHVASELAVQFDWVSRLDYAPQDDERPLVTPEMHAFASDVNHLLDVMYKLAMALRDSDQARASQREQLLQYAMHLAGLGLQITRPANYVYQHPDLPRWLKLPASILEQKPPVSLPEDVPSGSKFFPWPPFPRDSKS
jgi:hypothetical protein